MSTYKLCLYGELKKLSFNYHLIPTLIRLLHSTFETRCEKTGLRGFRPGPTRTRLYSHRRWLEASNFLFRKKRYCTTYVVKTKALISFEVTVKLICVFVFAYAKSRFSHDTALFFSVQSSITNYKLLLKPLSGTQANQTDLDENMCPDLDLH